MMAVSHRILSDGKNTLKALQKGQGGLFGSLFEKLAEHQYGPFRAPTIASPPPSDDEDESDDADSVSSSASVGDGAASTSMPLETQRILWGSLLLYLNNMVRAQTELAKRLQSRDMPVFHLVNAIHSSPTYLAALQRCHASLYNSAKEILPSSCEGERKLILENWVKSAIEMCQRSEALLSWAQLKGVGEDQVRAASPASTGGPLDTDSSKGGVLATTQVSSPAVMDPPAVVEAVTGDSVAPLPTVAAGRLAASPGKHVSASAVTSQAGGLTASVASSSVPVLQPPRRAGNSFDGRHDNEDERSDDDEGDGCGPMQMISDGLLSEVAASLPQPDAEDEKKACMTQEAEEDGDEIYFNLPRHEPGVPLMSSPPPLNNPPPTPLFDMATPQGRRNCRAFQLLSGYVLQTNEEMTEMRQKLTRQSATIRNLMCAFGKTDYNILTYQIRSTQLQIGESGPLMWSATLDVCVSTDYEDTENKSFRWMEERTSNTPPVANPAQRCKWIELVQSEPCTRGSYAKTRIVSLAANLLFPTEFEYYRSLERDDVVAPDNSPEWQNVRERTVGVAAPYGRMVSFVLDRTSYAAQAFQLFERLRPEVGPLHIAIEQDMCERTSLSSIPQISAYVVRITLGNGTLLVAHSSRVYKAAHVQATSPDAPENAPAFIPALLPTFFDSFYLAAEKLGVLDSYLLLKRSFDRLRLPVANEPREYVLNYLSVIFGMQSDSKGVLKDTFNWTDQSFASGWSTTVRVAYTHRPTDITQKFNFVDLYTCYSSTKKAAHNDALLIAGKTNLFAEMLRMVDYAPVGQRGHAELLLMVPCCTYFALHEDTAEFDLPPPPSARVVEDSKAPGGSVAAAAPKWLRSMFWYEQVIAKTIARCTSKSIVDIETWLKAVHPTFAFTTAWDKEAAEAFLMTLTEEERTYGEFVFPPQPCTGSIAAKDLRQDERGNYCMAIRGISPSCALYFTGRALRERLDNAGLSRQGKGKGSQPKKV